ncbi:MAG: glycosyltransferase family 4 protein [Propionivibrio sp.]
MISALSAGGAERVMAQMANYWCEARHEVVLVTFSSSSKDDFYPLCPQVERVCLDFRRETHGWFDKLKFNAFRLFALRHALTEVRPDAVISFMDSTNVLTVLAATSRRYATILSVRNNPKFRRLPLMWRLGRRLTYRFATAVVAQTEGAAQWIRAETSARVCVIANPVRSVKQSDAPREQFILAVGRLVPEKGYDLLIRAFARVASTFPDWKMIILGDGPLRAPITDWIDQAGLVGRVEMLGITRDVDAWFSRCGLYVHSSRSEGFPNALIEAMAAGAPVLGCDCDYGPGEIIENGVSGLLVPAEDEQALAEGLASMIADDALRARLGQQAPRVRERFDMAQVMKRWEKLIE